MQLYINKKDITPHPTRLRYLARRHAQELERIHNQEGTQRLVKRLQDIIFGLGGLTQVTSSPGGGRSVDSPTVISVAEQPMRFNIRILPGQIPDDFTAQAKRIAYGLGVAEIRVIPLGPSLIQLILVPKPTNWRRDDSTT